LKLLVVIVSLLASATCYAHGMSDADRQAMLDAGYLRYVSLGATHMLTGYDHLLFLFGVVFFLRGARDVVKFVSLFTLGHSITLIGATFAGITANYFLVDAVIALSVCYKGFDNNDGFRSYLGVRAPNLLWMVFGFGLVHGFGLSTRLQQLPLGDKGLGFLGRIVAFNVGVELGQLAALLVMVALLSYWRSRPAFPRFSRVSNDGLILAGFLLFLMQMHGYLHTTHPDEFGFNADGHDHAHEEMDPGTGSHHDNIEGSTP
jgi:hypothetical protein